MKSIVLDTNALLRYFLNDVPAQKEEVEKLFLRARSRSIAILVPQIIVFELYYALLKYYKVDKLTIASTLKSLISTDFIDIESRAEFILSIELFSSHSLSFADCFVLVTARELDAELFTFDKKLKKSASKE